MVLMMRRLEDKVTPGSIVYTACYSHTVLVQISRFVSEKMNGSSFRI